MKSQTETSAGFSRHPEDDTRIFTPSEISGSGSEEEVSFSNRRQHPRWRLTHYPRVMDADSGEVLGHVQDVNQAGLRLLTRKPLREPQRRDLVISVHLIPESTEDMPEEISPADIPVNKDVSDSRGWPEDIRIAADIRWSRRSSNPRFFDTGMVFDAPSTEDVEKINSLIKLFQTGILP